MSAWRAAVRKHKWKVLGACLAGVMLIAPFFVRGEHLMPLERESAVESQGLELRIRQLKRLGPWLRLTYVWEVRQRRDVSFRGPFGSLPVSFWDAEQNPITTDTHVIYLLPLEFTLGEDRPFRGKWLSREGFDRLTHGGSSMTRFQDTTGVRIPDRAAFVSIGYSGAATRKVRIPD